MNKTFNIWERTYRYVALVLNLWRVTKAGTMLEIPNGRGTVIGMKSLRVLFQICSIFVIGYVRLSINFHALLCFIMNFITHRWHHLLVSKKTCMPDVRTWVLLHINSRTTRTITRSMFYTGTLMYVLKIYTGFSSVYHTEMKPKIDIFVMVKLFCHMLLNSVKSLGHFEY